MLLRCLSLGLPLWQTFRGEALEGVLVGSYAEVLGGISQVCIRLIPEDSVGLGTIVVVGITPSVGEDPTEITIQKEVRVN